VTRVDAAIGLASRLYAIAPNHGMQPTVFGRGGYRAFGALAGAAANLFDAQESE
jgi:hypothetical protein